MQSDPAATAKHVRLVERDTVGSTNAEALKFALAGEKGPLWVMARRQTAGRGRRGRAWISEPGNLYASLLLIDPSPPDRAFELSFVAALAVHDAVAVLAPAIEGKLGLKWPNDALVEGRKFCGILIEGEGSAVVVGIGVNCAHHPQQTVFPAADLAEVGAHMAAKELFTQLSATMLRRIGQWNRGGSFDSIRNDWIARAAGIGEPVRIALADGERAGLFETIDARGRLILRLADGSREAVTAGDVVSLTPKHSAAAAAER
jgi:BirA family biotin operon repressor/biotin-[acetyl-CoA-carboxylase] ligase